MNPIQALALLEKNNYFVWDDFLSSSELSALQKDFHQHYAIGNFKRAGIGKGKDFHLNDEVRLDETYWCEPPLLFHKLKELKNKLNEHFFLGLWEFEGHYSRYPTGGLYHAHLDRFNQDDARTVSMVLYLNSDWKNENGGELRLHHPGGQTLDISPIGGRLVCFFSGDVLHEVLPATEPRFSFAGWWKRR